MNDRNKTKQQLVDELQALRRAYDELERNTQKHTAELIAAHAAVQHELAECQRAHEVLRTSEARYRAVVEDMPALICRFLPDGLLTFVNDQYCAYFNRQRQDLEGHNFFQFIPEEERETVRRHYAALTPDRPTVTYEHQVVGPDGAWRWQRWTDRALFDARGQPSEYQSLGEDITDRKQVEEELRESEERFRTLAETTSAVIVLYDTERLLYANSAAQKLAGYTQEELLQKSFMEIIHPESRADMEQRVQRRLRGETLDDEVEIKIVTRSGEERWITLRGGQTRYQHRLVGMGTAFDITDRKQAEEALRENEMIFSSFLEHSPVYVFFKDKNARAVRLSRNYEHMLGMPLDRALGKTMDDLFPSDLAKSMIADDLRVLLKGQRVDVVEELGGRIYETTKFPIIKDGQPFMLAGFTVDITERQQAEAALRESQQMMSVALRAARAGAWKWDRNTNKATWSDENFLVMGLTPGSVEAAYANWLACVHPDDRQEAERRVAEAIERRSELNAEFRVIWPDGSVHWLNDIGQMIVDETGEPVGMYGIQMDITERVRIEQQRMALLAELEARNAELERFIYTVSHDLKSPLITIQGFLGFLENDALTGNFDRLHADIERIAAAATRMQQLLDELLELSRVGRQSDSPELIPFEQIAREAVELTQGRLMARGVQVEIGDNLPSVYGDRTRLVEVVQNLVDNAVKFMGDQSNPRICIGVTGAQGAGLPVFFVQDNGAGIAPEYHERIFGLFNKLDLKSEGTGVGLALVKRIVEVHGGKIWVESAGANSGATFYFTLPPKPLR